MLRTGDLKEYINGNAGKKDIMVSVLCLAYNHENYISKALDSILMQKTDFKIEVIVHDDASTDQTARIIRQYYKKYPEIIVPVFQQENQYSAGKWIISDFMCPKIRGRYVAICEGDDYWTDPLKLQKQAVFMEAHPEYSSCIHAAYCMDALTGKTINEIRLAEKDMDFGLTDAIRGLGSKAPTNSVLYRADINKKKSGIEKSLPFTGVGDNLDMIIYSMFGPVHYINEVMSVYRSGVPGSWSDRMGKSGTAGAVNYLHSHISLLNSLKPFAGISYIPEIDEEIRRIEFSILRRTVSIKEMKGRRYRDLYVQLPYRLRVKLRLKQILYMCLGRITARTVCRIKQGL